MEKVLEIVDNYILILDTYGNIKFCNKKLLEKLEYSIDEIINLRFDKIAYNGNNNLQEYIDVIEESDKFTKDIELVLHSKTKRELHFFGKILVDNFKSQKSIMVILKDFCEKTYTREDLEKMLDNMPFNCWLKNTEGQYLYINESYAKELNDTRINILGKKTNVYWSKDNSDSFTKMDREVIETKKYQLTESYSKEKNGSDLWVEVYKAPIFNSNNEVEYVLGFTKDITLQKKMSNEVDISNTYLNNLNNILMSNNTKNNINDILSNTGENILKYFGCDGVSVILLDKEKSYLDMSISVGASKKNKVNEALIKINIEELHKLSSNLEGIHNINSIDNKLLKVHMSKNNIENIGIYNIEFNDEIIGFLVITYLKGNTPKFNKSDYLKTISRNIATMIKSRSLSKDLQEEFNKRRKIESELELFLDISVDLIARGSIDGKITHINNNWQDSLGWSKDELLSMNILDIIHYDNKDTYIDTKRSLNNDEGSTVCKLLCKDGSYIWVELNYKVLRCEDTFMITAKDISKQKEEEEQRKILEEAMQLESLKNEFFANISHEFRTPINIILGTMQLMKRNVDQNKIHWDESLNLESHINYIKQNAYRLLRLVNNLIDITCIDSGYYQLQLGNYNIVEIIENITLSVAQYTKDKGINLIFDTNCEEKIIACDPDKIERIVLNLLSNAIKYTDKSGNIYVGLKIEDDIVKISVKDDGVGMSSDKLDIIFDRFKRIDNNLNRKCEGSGIGLSLVKSLVELLDGRIYVSSELGVGSEFIFELPNKVIQDYSKSILDRNIPKSTQIEKCNIEFSDIYSYNLT